MTTRQLISIGVAVGLLPGTALNLKAQLTLTGTNYFQSFDTLDAGLPAGWMVCTNAHATNLGTAVTLVTGRTSWSSQTGQFQNSASTSNAGTNLVIGCWFIANMARGADGSRGTGRRKSSIANPILNLLPSVDIAYGQSRA